MCVLITGMSGVGKSSLVHELRRRGLRAVDADEDGFSEPRADGRQGWRAERVAELLEEQGAGPLFFAGWILADLATTEAPERVADVRLSRVDRATSSPGWDRPPAPRTPR
jgi:serine kinase of HPr protein (carbohydrate metabolism regulator)